MIFLTKELNENNHFLTHINNLQTSLAKCFGNHNMTLFYPNPCYNEVYIELITLSAKKNLVV